MRLITLTTHRLQGHAHLLLGGLVEVEPALLVVRHRLVFAALVHRPHLFQGQGSGVHTCTPPRPGVSKQGTNERERERERRKERERERETCFAALVHRPHLFQS